MTAQELIKAAYRKLAIIATGETPSDDELADGLEALKVLLRLWSGEGITAEVIQEITHTLTAGDASYTIAASGGDITADWPVEIMSGFLTVGSIDYPLTIVDERSFDQIAVKTHTGIPSRLNYKPSYSAGVIRMYPVPQSAYAMTLRALTLMDEPSGLTSSVAFPPFYDGPIIFNLAVHMAPEFGIEPSPTVASTAYQMKEMIQARNLLTRTKPVKVQINDYYRRATIDEG